MRPLPKVLLSLAAISIFANCGYVSVVRAPKDPDGTDTKTKGVRFYRPAPYLWITPAAPPDKVNIETKSNTTNKPADKPESSSTTTTVASTSPAAFTAQIIFLPDKEEEYIIQWESGTFGTIHPKFILENGWNLTSFEADVNTGLSASLSLTGAASLTKASDKQRDEIPGLYKLKYDEDLKAWTIDRKVFSLEDVLKQ
jgi:hypothetical protein